MHSDRRIRRVEIVRTGGFAGLRRSRVWTEEELGEAGIAAFRALDSGASPPARGADRFQYEITVEDEVGRQETCCISETAVAAALRRFLP